MGESKIEIAVKPADKIARGHFHRVEISPGEMSEAVNTITSKISQCLQGDCMDKLAESVRKADAQEEKHRLFFDMLEEVSEKLKGVEEIVRDIVQEVSGQGGEDQGDGGRLESIISKAMIAFARLGIGYKAEKTEKAFGLHNGEYFKTVLARRVADVFKERQDNDEKILNRLGVIFIDLNGLKNINELSLGKYSAGDKGLKILADILGSNELNSWAKSLGIKLTPAHYHGDEFLLMVDAVDNKELDLVSNAKFVVQSSKWYENCPMTIIESFALNVPVIGSNHSGFKDFITDGITGYLLNFENEEEATKKIIEIDKTDIYPIKNNVRKYFKSNLSKEIHTKNILDTYNKLLKKC